MLHSVVSPWCSLFLYSVMPFDVRQCCVTTVFPLYSVMLLDVTQTCVVSPWYSLTLYSVMPLDVTQTVLYHHGIPSFQWLFLPDPTIRSKLTLPPRAQVDYRAACFCHRQLIDIGYVCSVCLSSKCVCN